MLLCSIIAHMHEVNVIINAWKCVSRLDWYFYIRYIWIFMYTHICIDIYNEAEWLNDPFVTNILHCISKKYTVGLCAIGIHGHWHMVKAFPFFFSKCSTQENFLLTMEALGRFLFWLTGPGCFASLSSQYLIFLWFLAPTAFSLCALIVKIVCLFLCK